MLWSMGLAPIDKTSTDSALTGSTDAVTAYLDNAATTAMHPPAIDAMLPYLTEHFGNPSGAHSMARDARRAMDDARDQIASAVGARSGGDVIFCSGGTESDNLAVLGVAAAEDPSGVSMPVCSAIEHHAVLESVEHRDGQTVQVGSDGIIDLGHLETILTTATRPISVVSVMMANNEVGVIQPIAAVAEVVRRHAPGALIHTDAVQAFCWLDLADITPLVDMVSISAHKFGGPKGIGALIAGDRVALSPRAIGGSQERERRGGTQNVGGAVAMGVAAELVATTRTDALERVAPLRDLLADSLVAAIPDGNETGISDGDRSQRLASVCHLCIDDIESEALLILLEREGIFASAASSCASGAMEPSHVLGAMGVPRDRAKGSLRLSLGYHTTRAEIDHAIAVIPTAVEKLRANESRNS